MPSASAGEVCRSRSESRIRLLFCLLLFQLALSGSFAEAAGGRRLLFLGNGNIAPVVYLDGGIPSGIAVDIVRALEKHMPKPIEIRVMNWTEAQALVARGEADALIQINQTEERKKIYDFSDTLLESQFSIFCRSDRLGISGLSSLRGLRVGVEAGGLPQQQLEKASSISLSIIPNFIEGFRQLEEGDVDAIVVDFRVGSYILAENGMRDIIATGEPIAFSYSAFAVKKGDGELLASINGALRAIKGDGTYEAILDKWKTKEGLFITQGQITRAIYLFTIAILIILSAAAIIGRAAMRKSLALAKTAEGKLGEQYSTLLGIINSADAIIFSLDLRYRYTSFNEAHAAVMRAIYGAEIEIGRSMLDYMTVAEDREAAKGNLDRALAGERHSEESYSGEELLSRKYFRVSHSPIKVDGGEVIGVAVLAQDISERRVAEEALRRQNRELQAISDCNQVLMRSEDEVTLLREICRIVCETAGYAMAWVGYAETDEAKTLRPVAWGGVEDGYLSSAGITWADTDLGCGPSGTAIRSGKADCIQDFATDPRAAPWRNEALQRGYRSSIALPLKEEGGRAFGTLNIYSAEPDAFIPSECRLLAELSGDLAFGICVLRTRVERKRVEEELRKLTEELEARVKARTEELEARNRDLVSLNRVFVDRELRMKELKDRIAKLEESSIRKGE